MNARKLPVGCALLVLLLLVGFVALQRGVWSTHGVRAKVDNSERQTQTTGGPADSPAHPTPAPPVGIPAIQPRIGEADPSTPSFTEEDVRQYVDTNNGRSLGLKISSASVPTIVKIEFLTEQELRARHGGTGTGLPDNALVCYVELSGTFTVASPFGKAATTYHKGVEVFDAHSGNLLVAAAVPD